MMRPSFGKKRNVRKILVVTLSNLGDVVLTLPVFQSLAQAYPGARLDAVVSPQSACVFETHPRMGQIHLYEKRSSWARKAALLGTIRRERYDMVIDLQRSLYGLLSGAPIHNSYLDFPKKRMHRVRRHLRALRRIVRRILDKSFLEPYTFDAKKLESLLVERGGAKREGDKNSGRLVVAAVGSRSDLKKWAPERFAALLDRLASEEGCRIALVGDHFEKNDADAVISHMKMPVFNLVGKTSFQELVGLLRHAALLVTNDSAPLHVADSLKTPVVALFGPTDPRKYGPRFWRSQVAQRRVFCSPCEKAQCPYHRECLEEISTEEVYKKASAILNDRFRPSRLKILIVRLDRVGDLIVSLPAVEAVRERFPEAHMAMMVRPYTHSLIESHPMIDEVIPYFYERGGRHSGPLGNLRFIWEIARRRFDIALILHPGERSHLVPFLAGIPYRIGFRSNFSSTLTRSIPDQRHLGAKHEAEYALDIVRAFGIEPGFEKPVPQLSVYVLERRDMQSRLESLFGEARRIIAIHAGASCPSKRWPVERFGEVGRALWAQDYGIAIVGGAEEHELGQRLASDIPGAVNLAGALSLAELPVFFSCCDLLIANDSGPVHVAAAVGVRVVSIFGRTDPGLGPRRWRPLGEGHEVIFKDPGCVVCLAHRCPINFECLQRVESSEVLTAAYKLLRSAKVGAS